MNRCIAGLVHRLLVLRSYCPCSLPCTGTRAPPSPALSAHDGELESLLGRSEDAVPLPGRMTTSSAQLSSRMGLGPSGLFGRIKTEHKAYSLEEDEDEAEDGHLPEFDHDSDAHSLGRSTIARLPEFAMQYEPTLTLEEIAGEEREQEERERKAGISEAERTSSQDVVVYEDFGSFEEGPKADDHQHEEKDMDRKA